MFAGFLPPKQAKFILPLVRRTSKNQRRLLPDVAAGKIEACIRECFSKVQSLGISMKYIDRSVVSHVSSHICEIIKQELIKGIVVYIIILYFTGGSFVVHIVRRVGYYQICLLTGHQKFIAFRFCTITAVKTMLSKAP